MQENPRNPNVKKTLEILTSWNQRSNITNKTKIKNQKENANDHCLMQWVVTLDNEWIDPGSNPWNTI